MLDMEYPVFENILYIELSTISQIQVSCLMWGEIDPQNLLLRVTGTSEFSQNTSFIIYMYMA